MAVKIRLRQQGKKNQYVYRLVVTDVRNPRDGRYIEMVGWYNPFMKEESNVLVNEERVSHWLDVGATLTEKAEFLVEKFCPQLMKTYREKKLAAAAKKRTARRELRKA